MKHRIRWFLINFKYAFRLNKPFLFINLIRNFFCVLFLNKTLLRYVDFAIGYRCNLNCKHCFAIDLIENDRHTITPSEYHRVAKEAMKLGAVNFSFQGGEPLLYPELEAYIKAVHPRSNLISVTTNGTLLNDTMLKKMKRWGVDILTVSLDSGIPEEHDNFRQKEGCFSEIYSGIKRALSYGFNITIGTVITSQNLRSEGIKRLIDISRNLRIILMLIPGVPIGRWKDKENILLKSDDIAYLEKMVSKYPYVRTDFDANYFKKGCGALKEILYLNPYGDVFACPFIHKKLGNVLSDSINTIRTRYLKNNLFKDYHNKCIATLKEVYSE
jgi:MoaA/NifB/PqqE/SkfB family radical SAM enzyme